MNNTSIKNLLTEAKKQLSANSDTAAFETELLLLHVLNVSRASLHAWPDKQLTAEQIQQFQHYIARRRSGEPIAYITGKKEFWSLEFAVTRDTLIPRPETELLVEAILQRFPDYRKITLADLGTGSGAIAIALAHERPLWEIHAVDMNEQILNVARQNAERLQANTISFHQGSWCSALPAVTFDVIVSNPPYIAEKEWREYESGLAFEPKEALLAENDGLADLKAIVISAKAFLRPGGYLFLEHGFLQGADVRILFATSGYSGIETLRDLASKERVTLAINH